MKEVCKYVNWVWLDSQNNSHSIQLTSVWIAVLKLDTYIALSSTVAISIWRWFESQNNAVYSQQSKSKNMFSFKKLLILR